jgi:SAM-dependent methyltransferase
MPSTNEPVHVVENRRYWNDYAPQWVGAGERAWGAASPYWGCWQTPESVVRMLPETMAGMAAVELGCGTAYGSAWMARRGARVLGVDVSSEQLATARRLASMHQVDIELMECNAEAVPWPDAGFDFALSEYGAATWCKPEAWVAEANRLLAPGGRLVFLGAHPLTALCSPADGTPVDTRLHRDFFGMRCLDWRQVAVEPGGIEFVRSHSEWLRLFRQLGFVVEDHLELQAPAGAADRFSVPGCWARRFPAEQVWKLRKS